MLTMWTLFYWQALGQVWSLMFNLSSVTKISCFPIKRMHGICGRRIPSGDCGPLRSCEVTVRRLLTQFDFRDLVDNEGEVELWRSV